MISALMMINFPDLPGESGDQTDEKLILNKLTEEKLPVSKVELKNILASVETHENVSFSAVELVYVDEEEIQRINREYLDHDYVTDIITFRNDEYKHLNRIEGTIFCCAPRIREQADEYGEKPRNEFNRVFVHGLLHLAGYDDRTETEKVKMTGREDFYLGLV